MVAGEGQQRHVTRSFNGDRQPPLMFGTRAGFPPGTDAAIIIDEAAEGVHIFPLDFLDLIDTESAHLAA